MGAGISIIICCYNSASRIYETLRHLSLQKTPGDLAWEIVLVDNASTDNTRELASKLWRELGRSDIKLKIVNQPMQGLSFARTKGIAISRYNTIIFCDDDNWLQSNYLLDAYSILNSNPQIGAMGGTGIAVSDGTLPDWFEKYKFCFACYPQGKAEGALSEVFSSLYGAGLVIRREALMKLSSKKFEPSLPDRLATNLSSGGDTELCYAIRLAGFKLWFSEKLKFHHYLSSDRLSEKYLFRINESLAYSKSNLIIYDYVLIGKEVTRFVWLKDIIYQLILLCNSSIRFLNVMNPSFERRMNLAFSFYSMIGILNQCGKYRLRYKEILRLKE